MPTAGFSWQPQKPVEGLDDVFFANASKGEQLSYFNWYFTNNDGKRSSAENTSCFFRNAGTYPVAFVVQNEHGCSDSIVKLIEVQPDFQFYMPNSFMPNRDGRNEEFRPVTRNVKQYHFMVYSRWGELIFESTELPEGWNGKHRGETCKQGIYVWKVKLTTGFGEARDFQGFVNLLR